MCRIILFRLAQNKAKSITIFFLSCSIFYLFIFSCIWIFRSCYLWSSSSMHIKCILHKKLPKLCTIPLSDIGFQNMIGNLKESFVFVLLERDTCSLSRDMWIVEECSSGELQKSWSFYSFVLCFESYSVNY